MVAMLLAGGGLLAGVIWLAAGGVDWIAEAINNSAAAAAPESSPEAGPPVVESFAAAADEAFRTVLVFFWMVAAFGMLMLLALLMVILTATSWGVQRAARRTDQAKVALIQNEPDIERVVGRIRRTSKRLLAPRLVAIRVADPIWRLAVTSLSEISTVIVADVSQPSRSLEWEVSTFRAGGPPMVFIAQAEQFIAWTAESSTSRWDESLLAAELRARPTLTYTARRSELRRFASALRTSLDASLR